MLKEVNMKNLKLGLLSFVLAMTLIAAGASALSWDQISGFSPHFTGTFAVLNPFESYTNIFTLDTSAVEYNSCNIPEYYQIGSCDFLFKCYVIMPETCDNVACAKDYDCDEIVDLQNPETLSVSYTPSTTEIGQTYAISAFVMRSHLEYNFETKQWTDTTTPYEDTIVYDYITIEGAPSPTIPNPLEKLGDFINSLLAGLKSWICINFGLWC